MDKRIADLVRERAEYRCEYCRFPEQFAELPFEVDHIVARQHGGELALDNLALACCHCNRYKGPNLAGIDPQSRDVVRLFNPRRDIWERHFHWEGARLVARTPIGGATIRLLQINREIAVAVRALLMQAGEYAGRGGRVQDGANERISYGWPARSAQPGAWV